MNKKHQWGASLIEVLVTALILGIGLLGLAALQARSLQYNHGSALRSQANVLAYDIIDRMRINKKNVSSYAIAYGVTPSGTGLANSDLTDWKNLLAVRLPSGDGAIVCAAATTCSISVRWRERMASEDRTGIAVGDADAEFSEFVYTTRF